MSEKSKMVWKGILVVAVLIACVLFVVWVGKAADKLVFVNVPGSSGSEEMEMFVPILEHVSEVSGIEIEYKIVTDYAACIQALRFGYADIARLGPFQYVQARELAGVFPVARDIKSNTREPFYYSLILARASLDFVAGEVVARDLMGKTMAFVSPTSTSGYMVPETMLRELGLTDDDFNEVYFAGSHASSIAALANGMVDLACTNEFRYLKAIDAGVITPDDVTIIMKSEPIPTDPVVLRPGLGEETVALLTAAWLTVPATACEPFKLDGFAPAIDRDYDPIRAIADTLDLNP